MGEWGSGKEQEDRAPTKLVSQEQQKPGGDIHLKRFREQLQKAEKKGGADKGLNSKIRIYNTSHRESATQKKMLEVLL